MTPWWGLQSEIAQVSHLEQLVGSCASSQTVVATAMSASWIGVVACVFPAKAPVQSEWSSRLVFAIRCFSQRGLRGLVRSKSRRLARGPNTPWSIRAALPCTAPPAGNRAWILMWAYWAEPVAAIRASPLCMSDSLLGIQRGPVQSLDW